ncbi:helicase domain-containing protein [Halomonas sp. GFAJ-1]|nr:helicase domain-containing protein [Halomonas sp. GFAJ-1]
MRLAAVLAEALIKRGDIDYVVYLGPTRAVVNDARDTLETVLKRSLDGQLGAVGVTLTYHALTNRLASLKQLCLNANVFLIWDESHHASAPGGQVEAPNQWGMTLVVLERYVRFTLALSGTPWRTDGSCLPLLRYVEQTATPTDVEDKTASKSPRQRLIPDFVYTLKEAIQDSVCRYPHIELVDNRSIGLTRIHPRTGQKEARQYASIPQLLRHPGVHYAHIIRDDAPLSHLLTLGINRLSELRQHDPYAGGLMVAASIQHAEEITQRLENAHQSVCLVTSNDPTAHAQLKAFRCSQTAWIVSVGMVTEGVNLPRLRVCCYLSHVRTEQFFRQVLGRIIRRQNDRDTTCYLYALNEPSLRRFARRLADDLPDDLAYVTPVGNTDRPAEEHPRMTAAEREDAASATTVDDTDTHQEGSKEGAANADISVTFHATAHSNNANASIESDVAFSQAFYERLVALRLVD